MKSKVLSYKDEAASCDMLPTGWTGKIKKFLEDQMSKRKLSFLERIAAVREYLAGGATQRDFANRLGIGESTFRDWVVKYSTDGPDALVNSPQRRYPPDIKKAAVLAYLQKDGSLAEICKKYKIKDRKTLRCWLRAYNGDEQISALGEKRSTSAMRKGRSTTLHERISIVCYCLESSRDYIATAEKFSVSYQQVYSWVKKYEALGAQGLVDRRGKRKDAALLSDEERLRAENELLLARIKQAELENIVLKKLEEVERRGC